jgi:hypothetical protein
MFNKTKIDSIVYSLFEESAKILDAMHGMDNWDDRKKAHEEWEKIHAEIDYYSALRFPKNY